MSLVAWAGARLLTCATLKLTMADHAAELAGRDRAAVIADATAARKAEAAGNTHAERTAAL